MYLSFDRTFLVLRLFLLRGAVILVLGTKHGPRLHLKVFVLVAFVLFSLHALDVLVCKLGNSWRVLCFLFGCCEEEALLALARVVKLGVQPLEVVVPVLLPLVVLGREKEGELVALMSPLAEFAPTMRLGSCLAGKSLGLGG
jgi:hypothetical protein